MKHTIARSALMRRGFYKYILLISFTSISYPQSVAANSPNYQIRNEIDSGDESINIIANNSAEVVVFLNENNQLVAASRQEVLERALSNEPSGNLPINIGDDFSDDLAIAEFAFSIGQYSTSAVFYERALAQISTGSQNSRIIEGLVTASFFGSSRHLEGLLWICQRYQSLPWWDTRFRHAIHAHLRSLAVNLGHQHAESILNHVTNAPECRRRRDFSPVWIPIHLADMRALERSVSPLTASYGISIPKDREYAELLLARSEAEDIPFIDYLHFVLGNYSLVIENYPDSFVFDLALLGAASDADYPASVELFLRYASNFERHRSFALNAAFLEFLEAGDQREALAIIEEHGSEVASWQNKRGGIFFQVRNGLRVWVVGSTAMTFTQSQTALISGFYSQCPSISEMLRSPATFSRAINLVGEFGKLHKENFADGVEFQGWYGAEGRSDYTGGCGLEFIGDELSGLFDLYIEAAEILDGGSRDAQRRLATSLKVCGDIREGRDPEGNGLAISAARGFCERVQSKCEQLESFKICNAISMHRLAAGILEQLYNSAPWEEPADLFLAGLAYRNNQDYERYAKVMQSFIARHQDHSFVDDALTELGWFFYRVADDHAAAEARFLTVLAEHAGSNAENNALNWLILLYLDQGDILRAAQYSSQLAVLESSMRMRSFSDERNSHLQAIKRNLVGVFSPTIRVSSRRISAGSPQPECVLQISDTTDQLADLGLFLDRPLCTVDSVTVSSWLEFYAAVAAASEDGKSSVVVSLGIDSRRGTSEVQSLPVGLFGF